MKNVIQLVMMIGTTLCTSMVVSAYGAPAKDDCEKQYDEAISYFRGMNHSHLDRQKGVSQLQVLAKEECPEAVASLAMAGLIGYYAPLVPKNKSAAEELANIALAEGLEKRAEEGRLSALVMLSNFYDFGLGVNEDHNKALELETQAATAGSAVAQTFLGLHYDDHGDAEKAIDWYQKAVAQGDAVAQYLLAIVYLHQATHLLQQSAAQGFEPPTKALETKSLRDFLKH